MSGDAVEDHFVEWLRRNMSGCHFAARVAAGPRSDRPADAPGDVPEMFRARLGGVDRGSAEVFTEGIGERPDRLCVALLPRVTRAADVAIFARHLIVTGKWSGGLVPNPGAPDRTVSFRLTWRPEEGSRSCNAMGFAPVPTMPTTRRAPFVALCVWTGGHANPHRPGKADPATVGFVDLPTGLDAPGHAATMTSTNDSVRRLLSTSGNDMRALRRLAFALPISASTHALLRHFDAE